MSWYPIVVGLIFSLFSALLFSVLLPMFFRRRARLKNITKVQSYNQLKRDRDSLFFLECFLFFWLLIWSSELADLIEYLGSWAGPVFAVGMILIERLAWLVFYLIDRRKAADGGPAAKT